MVRGDRNGGRRGGEGFTWGVRGSCDDRGDPADLEQDPYRYPADDDDDLLYPANDDCIWPVLEDEEDD
jgi:hypothetical protein